ncbi:MAG: vWA domain-containing protein [Candidatus Heimdallarchaeaceae archaeon]
MIVRKLKKVLIFILIGGMILGGIKINGNIETKKITDDQSSNFNTSDIYPESQEIEEPEIVVTFDTNLESHRVDEIPSIKSLEQFSFNFNITNINATSAYDVKLNFSINDLGFLVGNDGEEINNACETIGTLNGNESYYSQEYKVNITSNKTLSESLDLVIVLDQSGSMKEEIDILTSDLIKMVNEFSDTIPDLRIGLVLFGGEKENPYLFDELVTPLTSNIEQIVEILENTEASGTVEPWGDALWVAMNQMDWRRYIPNLIVLITDEPGDSGLKVSSNDLENLFEELADEKLILCTVAASGSNDLTIERLKLGAEITHGSFVEIGTEEFPSTADLPKIIKYFIETYSFENAFKIFVTISYLTTESDPSSSKMIEKVFRVLVDDLAPEIRTWVSYSEDFKTEKKYINIIIEVLDITGVPFVEIYYRYNDKLTWIIGKATNHSDNSFILSLEYDDRDELLSYYIYTEDYLGNEVVTDVYKAPLGEKVKYTILLPNERLTVHLFENQSTIIYLQARENSTIGLVDSESPINILCLDTKKGILVLDKTKRYFVNFSISPLTVYKIKIWSDIGADINIYNVEKMEFDFQQQIYVDLAYNQSILLHIDNRLNLTEERSILADAEDVELIIIIYGTNWTKIDSGFYEVILPEIECYVLIYSVYHEGKILVSFDLESKNVPFEHYNNTVTGSYQFLFTLISFISLSALIFLYKGVRK